MTEYWVSQGNKWCEFCKIYIANNPVSIRTHELGHRHKENVAKRLASMRQENIEKEKAQKEAARAFVQIEAKAKKIYQEDLAAFSKARESGADASFIDIKACKEWEYDSVSGYYYNKSSGCHYDPNSGIYCSAVTEITGKWVTQKEAFQSDEASKLDKNTSLECKSSKMGTVNVGSSAKSCPHGKVVSLPLNPLRPIKGAPSSIAVNKRKRDDKAKDLSKEDEAALKAREAARKRVEEREAPLLGLYRSY